MIRNASPRRVVIRRGERKRRMKHRPAHMVLSRPTATQPTNPKGEKHYHPDGVCAHHRRCKRGWGSGYTRELWKGILKRRLARWRGTSDPFADRRARNKRRRGRKKK